MFYVSLTVPSPGVNVAILDSKNKTVGSKLSLECNITTVMGISSGVKIVWIKNDTMVNETSNDRIKIVQKNSTHTMASTLQFLYLSEDDESNYTCSAMIHDSNNSESIELNNFDSTLLCLWSTCVPYTSSQNVLSFYCVWCVIYCINFVVPKPNVSVTAESQNVGGPLSLKCDVAIVRGITSDVYVAWTANGNELEPYNGNVTENTTAYTYYYDGERLITSKDNNTVYQCQVTINNRSQENDSLTLHVIGQGK